jgi:P-type Cu2+ transporter
VTTTARSAPETAVLHVGGLYYASEKGVVEQVLARRPGVLSVEANPVAQTATVTYDAGATSLEALRDWIVDCGYHCAGQSAPGHVCDPLVAPDHGPHDHAAAARSDAADGHGHGGHAGMSMASMVADMRNRFLVSLIFTIPIVLWSGVGSGVIGSDIATPFGIGRNWWLLLLSLPVLLYSSSIFFTGAWHALRAHTLDMMVLVAVAVGIAFAYSAAVTFGLSGETFYDAAAMLATFVLLGHWFEMRARGGANDAIRTLLDLAPPRATVIRDGEPIEMPTAEVALGDVLLIRPGTKVPVDAEVTDGTSQVDESAVTGESLPVAKRPGDRLIGATINKQGTLRAHATAIGSDTALAQIVALVQTAQNSKAPGQRLADRAAFWLVLVALTAGVATFLIWWAIVGRDVEPSLLFAIAVIVITCPDALGLATPTAIMVGSSLGAKRGILFKHALALERGAQIETVVFDKTGTLTRGEPQVVAMAVAPGQVEDHLLAAVASVERESEHPLATAIVRAASERGLPLAAPQAFEAIPGHGVLATIDGRRLAIGNHRLIENIGVAVNGLAGRASEFAGEGRTVVEVALDDHLAGLIAIADAPRETAAEAVRALRELGIRSVMLSGDSEATARRIADQVGIDDVIAEVLPADKAAKITELQSHGRKVAMVGDGVNDAPALAQADVGIAIGTGTDVAVETADIVLMRSDPLDVATAITISRGTLRKMHQNLAWAVGYNSLAIPVAAGVFEPLGFILRPEVGAISMSASSVIVAVNAIALKGLRLPHSRTKEAP